MRLSTNEQRLIKQSCINVFSDNSKIFVFGSRVDDAKKGGDLDLYIIPNMNISLENLYDKKIEFLSKLQLYLGEQKIDVVVSKDKNRSIEKEALATGIEL